MNEGKHKELYEKLKDDNLCHMCLGSGKIANDDEASPWPLWEALEPPANLAVQMGLVYPITCPRCEGKGC